MEIALGGPYAGGLKIGGKLPSCLKIAVKTFQEIFNLQSSNQENKNFQMYLKIFI